MWLTDKIQITNEDNMELMARYPDKYFDLAIVDPPYGINVNMNIGIRKGKRKKRKQKDWDNSVPDISYFNELTRISKNQIIWGGNYFEHLDIFNPQAKRLDDFRKLSGIVWDKGESMYGRDFSEAEIAYSSIGCGWIKLNPVQLERFHPTQKPVLLYKWLLHNYAKEGQKILDTHLGSGSIAIACHDYGFDLTACELDKEYYDTAIKRIKNHVAQLSMF